MAIIILEVTTGRNNSFFVCCRQAEELQEFNVVADVSSAVRRWEHCYYCLLLSKLYSEREKEVGVQSAGAWPQSPNQIPSTPPHIHLHLSLSAASFSVIICSLLFCSASSKCLEKSIYTHSDFAYLFFVLQIYICSHEAIFNNPEWLSENTFL